MRRYLFCTTLLLLATAIVATSVNAQDTGGAAYDDVQVFGPDGLWAEGARVWCAGHAEAFTADEHGLVRIPRTKREAESLDLLIWAEGVTPAYLQYHPYDRSGIKRLALRPWTPWELALVDEVGAPIAGAVVQALPALEGYELPPELMRAAAGLVVGSWTTDDDGVARLPFFHNLGLRVTIDDVSVDVLPNEFGKMAPPQPWSAPFRSTMTYYPEQMTEVRFTDVEDRPIAGKECRLPAWGGRIHAVRTDAEGRARVVEGILTARGFDPDKWPWRLSRPKYALLELGNGRAWATQVDPVPARKASEVDDFKAIEISFGPFLQGRRVEAATVPASFGQHGAIPQLLDDDRRWVLLDAEDPVLETGVRGDFRFLLLQLRDADTGEILHHKVWEGDPYVEPSVSRLRVRCTGDASADGVTVDVLATDVGMNWQTSKECAVSGEVEFLVPQGDLLLTGFDEERTPVHRAVFLEEGPLDVELPIGRIDAVSGRVCWPDGSPASTARVGVGSFRGRFRSSLTCTEAGEFKFLDRSAGGSEIAVFPGVFEEPLLAREQAYWVAGRIRDLDLSEPLTIPVGRVEFQGLSPGSLVTSPIPLWPGRVTDTELWEPEIVFRPSRAAEHFSGPTSGSGIPIVAGGYAALPGIYALLLGEGRGGRLFRVEAGKTTVVDLGSSPAVDPQADAKLRLVVGSSLNAGDLVFRDGHGVTHALTTFVLTGHEEAAPVRLPDSAGTLEYHPWFGGDVVAMDYTPPAESRDLVLDYDFDIGVVLRWAD